MALQKGDASGKAAVVLSSQETDAAVAEELVVRKDFVSNVSSLDNDMSTVTETFFDIGKRFSHIRSFQSALSGYYGFKDVYAFAEDRYHLKSTSVKNFINVYQAFRSKDGEYLDRRFEDCAFSRLVELLPLSDDKEFASKLVCLTQKQIREVKKDFEDKSIDGLQSRLAKVVRSAFSDMCVLNGWKMSHCSDDPKYRVDCGVCSFDVYVNVCSGCRSSIDDSIREEIECYCYDHGSFSEDCPFTSLNSLVQKLIKFINGEVRKLTEEKKPSRDDPKPKVKKKAVPESGCFDSLSLLTNDEKRSGYLDDISSWEFVQEICTSSDMWLYRLRGLVSDVYGLSVGEGLPRRFVDSTLNDTSRSQVILLMKACSR